MSDGLSAELVGMVAAVLSVLSLVPQVWRTWKTHSADDLSLGWLGSALLSMALWIAYGIMLHAWSVVVANSLASILVFSLLVMKFLFKSASSR